MQRLNPSYILVLSFIFALLISCDSNREISTEIMDLKTAKVISHLPAEIIEPNASIQVRFVEPQVDEDKVASTVVDAAVMETEPGIEGKLLWSDSRTLELKPDESLSAHEQYTVTLNLDALDNESLQSLDPLVFNIRVAGQELSSFDGDFRLVEAGNPKKVYYSGTLKFLLDINSDKLKEAISFNTARGQSLSYELLGTASTKEFIFKSEELLRDKNENVFVFGLDSDLLGLPAPFSRNITLTPLKDLKIINLRKDESGEQPRIRIDFSDELDPAQDINGFVSIVPAIDFTLRKMGNSVFVNGPFQYGQSYAFDVKSGIKSKWATTMTEGFHEEINFEDLLPEIKFSREGVFLPTSSQQKIAFMTVNVTRVHLKVTRVFESNLGQFLQMENLNGGEARNDQFNYNINRVGVTIVEKALNIGGQKNRWLQHELDLKSILNPKTKGLLLLEIYFTKPDMIYNEESDDAYANYRSRRNRNDYGKPGSYWYMRNKGRIFKPVILTDIGLTYKKLDDKAVVFATDLKSTQPLGSVTIRLRSYQNQVIKEGQTNSNGKIEFPVDENVFYVEGEKGGQRSVIKINEMLWNISNFDVQGRQGKTGGLNAFIYTERGVYRPGDTVNVSLVVRNKSGTFPRDHPITAHITNPRGQKVFTQTLNNAQDGFYAFRFNTQPSDPTGNYNARFEVGSASFNHNIKVETVVPERIKIKLDSDKDELSYQERQLDLDISANYLFGNPAANLEAEVDVSIRKAQTVFEKYKDFIFESEQRHFKQIDQKVVQRKLDGNGTLNVTWRVPDLSQSPGRVRARFDVKVLEKGGRPAQKSMIIPIEPYQHYVGIKRPDLKWGYAQVGSEYDLPVIVVNTAGQSVAGKNLKYTIYKNERSWWWEYNNRRDFRLRFKEDSNTEKIQQGQLVSNTTPTSLTFKADVRGEYLVEVEDGSVNGHSTAFFINAYYWGDSPDGQKNAGTLVLNSDRKEYAPGQEAVISFPVPQKGQVLLTVEKGSDMLSSSWYPVDGSQDEMRINIPVTEKMLPTAYVSVSLIQPHSETKNDRPLRTFGIIPLNVYDPATRNAIQIKMPDELETGKPFQVDVQTVNRRQTQFTIAVVDEGLLQLTNFQTPDPWNFFYSKERLGVLTYDLYGHVLGANKGDIFKTFSIGGGFAEMRAKGDKDEEKTAKRFKAVSMFRGPLQTNASGYARVNFDMPDYIGAVRVMVVAANNIRYGNQEKTVPVTSDLMVMPTLPRVLGPADQVKVPLTVFAMKDNLGATSVSIQVDGPLAVVGQSEYKLNFVKADEQDIYFTLKANEAVGISKIKITAKSEKATAEYSTELEVRTSSTVEYISEEKMVKPGQKISVNIPGQGIDGSNNAVVTVRRSKNLNFGERLFRLIRYPYGCLEQTTSSVFPQLYLEKFIPKSTLARQDIKENINEGIKRINRFRLSSGAFSYWPGSNHASLWATNYAGHFLIEAKKLGYHVPSDLMDGWLRFQKSQVLLTTGDLMTRVYRLYLLALAGEPAMGPMNLIRESGLSALKDRERWLLASAYKLAGTEKEAQSILSSTGIIVKLYREFAGTYGSSNRDKAIILDQMVQFGQLGKAASLVDELAAVIKSKRWLSTQESAFMLMAMGKYLNAVGDKSEGAVQGYVQLANGDKVDFNFTGELFDLAINADFGKDVSVYLNSDSKLNHVYAIMNWNGVPLRSTQKDEQKNLQLTVRWLNETGQPLDPATLVQGQTIWGHFKVGLQNRSMRVEELALTQVLPAGWEIENLRLNDGDLPSWTRGLRFVTPEYEDIRDDRISWFFDMGGYRTQDFLVKINAVTVGEFYMPGTTFGAMYDNDYRATKAGKVVKVLSR